MPKQAIRLIEANDKRIIIEGILGKGGRVTIPNIAKNLIKEEDKVRVTIEKL